MMRLSGVSRARRSLSLASMAIACFVWPFAMARERGTLKGREEMNAHLASRFDVPFFDVLMYVLPPGTQGSTGDLIPLLGGLESSPVGPVYTFVKPTKLTMLLWGQVASHLSLALSQACDADADERNPIGISMAALEDVRGLCRGPAQAPSRESLRNAWMLFVGFAAPEDEFETWADAVSSPAFTALTPKRYVAEALTALFLNPYVLLVL